MVLISAEEAAAIKSTRRYRPLKLGKAIFPEDIEWDYLPEGHHPVDLGDEIENKYENDIYTVLQKLSHSVNCSVWAVKWRPKDPTVNTAPKPKYHALKIYRANILQIWGGHQGRMLHLLDQEPGSGHPNIIQKEDFFYHTGPNGTHLCLVFPLLGPTLANVVMDRLSAATRHSVCQQLASAVAYMQSRYMCHGRLMPENVAFEIPGLESMSERELEDKLLGVGIYEELQEIDGSRPKHGPRRVYQPCQGWHGLDHSQLTTVRIIDFGGAFCLRSDEGDPPPDPKYTVHFSPPEYCFQYPLSRGADTWQLAMLIFMIHTGVSPFYYMGSSESYELLISVIAAYLGPAPQDWRNRFLHRKYGTRDAETGELSPPEAHPAEWFDLSRKQVTLSFQRELALRAPHLNRRQREKLEKLLLMMMAWRPDVRISAREVLVHLHEIKRLSASADGDEAESR